VSSSSISGPDSTISGGSIGVADFMNPEVLKTAKLWRFQKLSKAELNGLVEHLNSGNSFQHLHKRPIDQEFDGVCCK